jgi:hypothetical protein
MLKRAGNDGGTVAGVYDVWVWTLNGAKAQRHKGAEVDKDKR